MYERFHKISMPTPERAKLEIPRGRNSQKPKLKMESMKQNWNFQMDNLVVYVDKGEGDRSQTTPKGGVWIPSGKHTLDH